LNKHFTYAAFIGGLTHLVLNLAIELAFPDHWSGSPDRLLGMSYAAWSRLLWIPSVLLLVALIGVYRQLRHALGGLGKMGFWIAATGSGLASLGLIIEFWIVGVFLVPVLGAFRTGSPGSLLGYEINFYGSMLNILGLLILSAAALRLDLPRRWRVLPAALALTSASVFYFFFAELIWIHAVLYGLVWIITGSVLVQESGRSPA
jgi:hypothetical protein